MRELLRENGLAQNENQIKCKRKYKKNKAYFGKKIVKNANRSYERMELREEMRRECRFMITEF